MRRRRKAAAYRAAAPRRGRVPGVARLIRIGQKRKGGQRAGGPGPRARQGARKIDFAGFQRAVELLADARGCAPEAVRRAVVLSGGPQTNTHVTPDYVRLHDDKSTYSGARPAPRQRCGVPTTALPSQQSFG
jgi:hypothetical protein